MQTLRMGLRRDEANFIQENSPMLKGQLVILKITDAGFEDYVDVDIMTTDIQYIFLLGTLYGYKEAEKESAEAIAIYQATINSMLEKYDKVIERMKAVQDKIKLLKAQ